MHRSTKGAIAAAAAAFLLLGGAGTIAYWSDSATADGGSIASGELGLSAATCAPEWSYAPGNAGAGTAVDEIVPGDSITKTCSFTVRADGDNLAAAVSAPATVTYEEAPPATSDTLRVETSYTLAGAPLDDGAVVTDADDGATLQVAFTVAFPFGTAGDAPSPINANDTQNWIATLDALTVSLTQQET